MSKIRIAWFSIGLALLVILVGLSVPDENPLSIVQFPGWALAFGAVFAAEDTLLTKMKFEIIYWGINLSLWSIVFFVILYTAVRLKKRSTA